MKDFLMAAFPWIITGLCIAVSAVQMDRIGNKEKGSEEETYFWEGLCLGMGLGANLGLMGIANPGVGMCVGTLVGEVIGSMIPKKKKTLGERE